MDVALGIFVALFALLASFAILSAFYRRRKFGALAQALGGTLVKKFGVYAMDLALEPKAIVRYEIFSINEGESSSAGTRLTAQITTATPTSLAIVPGYGANLVSRATKFLLRNVTVEMMSLHYGPPLPSADQTFGGAYSVYCDNPDVGNRVAIRTASSISKVAPMSLILATEAGGPQLQATFRREILSVTEAEVILTFFREVMTAIECGVLDGA